MTEKFKAIPPPGLLELVFGGRPVPKDGIEVGLDEALELARSGCTFDGTDLAGLIKLARDRDAAIEAKTQAALIEAAKAEAIAADVEKALENAGGES